MPKLLMKAIIATAFLFSFLVTGNLYAYTGTSSKNYYTRTKNIDTYKEINYNFKAVTKEKGYAQQLCEASFPTSMVFTENSLFADSTQKWNDHSVDNRSWKLRSLTFFRTYINNMQILSSGSFENKFKYKGIEYKFIYNFAEVDNRHNRTIKGIIWNKYCKMEYQKILLHRQAVAK